MPIRIAPPILDLEAVRGIEVDVALAAGNDRQEPLYLWATPHKSSSQLPIPI
ncbi:hypothetical protein [Halomicronema sp. CCY15110]|uniref:hypothetical protein n=1 Tax=Halomicronema sp. CCY15110 TaxID=2767773 RepID=UPI00194E7349|nr:hypothetical protein [Halomicronema sp. CCY15110]